MKFNIAAILLVTGLAAAAPAVQAETRGESLEKRGCGAGYLRLHPYPHQDEVLEVGVQLTGRLVLGIGFLQRAKRRGARMTV
ncbi:hypothetical protein HYQ46_002151 [Verticillium longisporum]|nr:hypothetical protein HYQ44_008496 [Verticillium longisporum]KAG7148939.1 hypothetical protein HYQ46_002151 [Verticillium longisporum]